MKSYLFLPPNAIESAGSALSFWKTPVFQLAYLHYNGRACDSTNSIRSGLEPPNRLSALKKSVLIETLGETIYNVGLDGVHGLEGGISCLSLKIFRPDRT